NGFGLFVGWRGVRRRFPEAGRPSPSGRIAISFKMKCYGKNGKTYPSVLFIVLNKELKFHEAT
ncbi:hypothetical protein, partial [Achromobacter sp. AGC39]